MRKKAWYITSQPWISPELEETRSAMGDNFYSYGLTSNNRKTLEALFRCAHDQGLADHQVTIEELFHPATLDLVED